MVGVKRFRGDQGQVLVKQCHRDPLISCEIQQLNQRAWIFSIASFTSASETSLLFDIA
jgi:hypothetical protein